MRCGPVHQAVQGAEVELGQSRAMDADEAGLLSDDALPGIARLPVAMPCEHQADLGSGIGSPPPPRGGMTGST
jgi:hypothetical protein